jgi:outer membrane protein OmpA-like peptidoglycan-associated protein
MKSLRSVLSPMVTTASVLALSGVVLAQSPSDSHRAASARAHEIMSSAPCPLPRITKEKITEDQARDLAQAFADKNMSGFKVVRPLGYGGGYTTMCYQTINAAPARPLVLYSVEYSMDVKNPAGETRNLCVDQFGTVSEFCSDFGFAGSPGPAGPMGATGPMGAQGPAGAVGAVSSQPQVSGAKWSSFRDFLFDFDKSAIRSNETQQVSDIAAYMKQNPSVQVGIDGHTDPRGTDAFNQGLSERRVKAISEALVNAGVPSSRIKTGAFGESQPKCSEPTEPCWQSDRRVEVLINLADIASR